MEEPFLPFMKLKKAVLKKFPNSYEWKKGFCVEDVETSIEMTPSGTVITFADEENSVEIISSKQFDYLIARFNHLEGYPLMTKHLHITPITNGLCISPVIE